MSFAIQSFPFELLIELMAAHAAQSPEGSPVSRVEARLEASLDLASRAALTDLELWLDRNDFGWLCNARGVDRLSTAAGRLLIGAIPSYRARPKCESHILGTSFEGFRKSFPIIADPSLTPDFRQHVATEADKAWMLKTLQREGREAALRAIDPQAVTRH